MIFVTVSPGHIEQLLGVHSADAYEGAASSVYDSQDAGVQRLLNALPSELAKLNDVVCAKGDIAALGRVTVWEVIEFFHSAATGTLSANGGAFLEARVQELTAIGQELYHRPTFSADLGDARNSLAIHGVFPHGSVKVRKGKRLETVKVFIPDFSVGCTIFAVALAPRFSETIQHEGRAWYCVQIPLTDLGSIECHLCDRLDDVRWRAFEYAGEHGPRRSDARADAPQGSQLLPMHIQLVAPKLDAEEQLVIGAIIQGFPATRAMRQDGKRVPLIGGHRMLSASAIRQGLGAPVIRSTMPSSVSRPLPPSIKDFLLDAAETVGAAECTPLYPDTPAKEELGLANLLVRAGMVGRQSWELRLRAARNAATEVEAVCRQLGIEIDLQKWADPATGAVDLNGVASQPNLLTALGELRDSLHSSDIATSVALKPVLALYSQHKRVLGLVEYIILPKIEAKIRQRDGTLPYMAKGASGLWSAAFTGAEDKDKKHKVTKKYQPLTDATLNSTWELEGKKATLETQGNWVLHAQSHASNGPIGLAALLDGILARMSFAPEVNGVSTNLDPRTPKAPAQQLAALADRKSHSAACMTLYLGKVALMLRNAVEHGTDRVERDGLLVDTTRYWQQGRPDLGWLRRTAIEHAVSWRSALPLLELKTLPSVAKSFLLTAASLQRCLVLMSLVMHGAFSQLGI